jgi:glycine hydroxymethyltransferase
MVPFDDKSPFVTSGIRIGTPAITTRGMKENDMVTVATLMDRAISAKDASEETTQQIKGEVNELMQDLPLFSF